MNQIFILITRNGIINMSGMLRKIFANIKIDNYNNQPGKKKKGKKEKGNGGNGGTSTGEDQENEKDQNSPDS
jgi:hypothetical protein